MTKFFNDVRSNGEEVNNAKERLTLARDILYSAFDWGTSAVGGAYWQTVIDNVTYLVAEAESTGHSDKVPLKALPHILLPSSAEEKQKVPVNEVIHITEGGVTSCDSSELKGKLPWEWPEGHMRVGMKDGANATCKECSSKWKAINEYNF